MASHFSLEKIVSLLEIIMRITLLTNIRSPPAHIDPGRARYADHGGLLRHQIAPRSRIHSLASLQEEDSVEGYVPQDLRPRPRSSGAITGFQSREAYYC